MQQIWGSNPQTHETLKSSMYSGQWMDYQEVSCLVGLLETFPPLFRGGCIRGKIGGKTYLATFVNSLAEFVGGVKKYLR